MSIQDWTFLDRTLSCMSPPHIWWKSEDLELEQDIKPLELHHNPFNEMSALETFITIIMKPFSDDKKIW